MIGIYKITSPIGCIYIGQSINIEKRLRKYRSISMVKNQRRLYNSFLEYGIINHVFEIVCECDKESLNELERYYQDLYECIGDNGLNVRLTTTKNKQGYYSEECRQRMSLNRTGEKNHMYGKVGEKHPNFGFKHTEETRAMYSATRKGKKKSDTHKKNIGIPQIGGGNHQAKLVVNIIDGIFYDCVKDAAEAHWINRYSLSDWLNNRRGAKNKTNLRFA